MGPGAASHRPRARVAPTVRMRARGGTSPLRCCTRGRNDGGRRGEERRGAVMVRPAASVGRDRAAGPGLLAFPPIRPERGALRPAGAHRHMSTRAATSQLHPRGAARVDLEREMASTLASRHPQFPPRGTGGAKLARVRARRAVTCVGPRTCHAPGPWTYKIVAPRRSPSGPSPRERRRVQGAGGCERALGPWGGRLRLGRKRERARSGRTG